MNVIILVLVVIAALFAIGSGIWVAIALVTALFTVGYDRSGSMFAGVILIKQPSSFAAYGSEAAMSNDLK
jgi:hypothetical protein